ncbi:hypothetical protein WOC76_22245 [Methylocystis sp. IM3]|uniref:hypothetical protein n=1 Tax=unclassified Methylocystis TaxID=2625913 RepID=UPI0030FA8508
MTQSPPSAEGQRGLARRDDILHILGDLDDGAVMALLSLKPMIVDLEEASIWLSGDRDVFGAGRPLKGVASQIVTLLTADEEEEASRSR